jgi:asparagine synthase (glutamine-hydrolysing)
MAGMFGKLSFEAQAVIFTTCTDAIDGSMAAARGANERGTIRAIADSALTNAAQLRAELERREHQFRSRTDADIVVHAYEEWGAHCFARFRGPFACALWDESTRTLVVGRDHLGIRPVYFSLLHGNGVAFATEVRALLQDPGVGREYCAEAIDAYLALGCVPAPLSVFKRISKLEPGHVLTVQGRRLRVDQYWDFPAPAEATRPNDAAERLEASLRTAVRRSTKEHDHDPTALLYSGGTASSVLVATAPREAAPVLTVDLDSEPSELTRSDRAAAHLGRVRELEGWARPTALLIKEFAARCGEPLADPAAVAQFAIALAARKRATSAIAGHGATVLWPSATPRTFTPTTDYWDDHRRRELYTRAFGWQVRDTTPLRRHLELRAARDTGDELDRARYVNARVVLPDSILASADRAATGSGLTLTFPFLDLPLVEAAASMSGPGGRWRHSGAQPLRAALAKRLPPDLLPPARSRTRQHPWLPLALGLTVPSMLFGPRFDGRGIISRPALLRLWEEHRDGDCDHSRRLWALVMLEFWFREFVDDDASAEEPLEYAVVKTAA